MPDYTKRVQTGTARDGTPEYADFPANYKKTRPRSGDKKQRVQQREDSKTRTQKGRSSDSNAFDVENMPVSHFDRRN